MIFTITDERGNILRTGHCTDGQEGYQAGPGEVWHEGRYDHKTQYFHPPSKEWLQKAPRPAPHFTWDMQVMTWVDARTMAERVAAARARIAVAFERSQGEPISYRGAMLDADFTAQGNISGKLLEIDQRRAAGMDMPEELLFWRDADNIEHRFETIQAYQEWLGGLAIAIAQRRTEAYAMTWGWKRQLEQAEQQGSMSTVDRIPMV